MSNYKSVKSCTASWGRPKSWVLGRNHLSFAELPLGGQAVGKRGTTQVWSQFEASEEYAADRMNDGDTSELGLDELFASLRD